MRGTRGREIGDIFGSKVGSISPSSPPYHWRRLLLKQDLYTEDTGSAPSNGYAPNASRMLGLHEFAPLRQKRTDLLAVQASPTPPRYRDRQSDWAPIHATYILIGRISND